jgi:hypothetical protein
MNATKPFGDLTTATILVIGHDPRLQRSQAQAEVAFFFDYLTRPRPTSHSEARKYDLAKAVWDYVSALAGREVSLGELYVTNLCNEFLEHAPGRGTVLIPDDLAGQGVQQITQTIASGRFKVILSMAAQTFYHLCHLGFIDEDSEVVRHFIQDARPRASKAAQGIYVQSGKAPFLAVCGCRFHHRGVAVVPIVHVRQWPLRPRAMRYAEPMARAQQEIRQLL